MPVMSKIKLTTQITTQNLALFANNKGALMNNLSCWDTVLTVTDNGGGYVATTHYVFTLAIMSYWLSTSPQVQQLC